MAVQVLEQVVIAARRPERLNNAGICISGVAMRVVSRPGARRSGSPRDGRFAPTVRARSPATSSRAAAAVGSCRARDQYAVHRVHRRANSSTPWRLEGAA